MPLKGKTDEAKRKSIARSITVASISPDAKSAARDALLDDSLSALLAVAKEPTPEAQVKKVQELAEKQKARPGRSKHRHDVGDKIADADGTQFKAELSASPPTATMQPEDEHPELPMGIYPAIWLPKNMPWDVFRRFNGRLLDLEKKYGVRVVIGRRLD